MGRPRANLAGTVARLFGIVVLGLAVGAGLGIGLAVVAHNGDDEQEARAAASRVPITSVKRPSAATRATPTTAPLTPIDVPGIERGALRVLWLGDDLLAAYRPTVTRALQAHRTVTETVHTVRGNTAVPRGAFAALGDGADLIFLAVGTGDLEHGTNAEAFNTVYKGIVRRIHVRHPKAVLVCLGVHGALQARRTQTLDQVIAKRCRNDTFVPITRIGTSRQIATTIVPRLRFGP